MLAALAAASASGAIAQSGAGAPRAAPKALPTIVVPPAPPVAPPAPPAPPAPSEPIDIHALRPAFVPFVALPLDTAQTSDPIWVKGDRPASSLIARMTLRPAETIIVEQDLGQGAGKKLVLLRAFAGDQKRFRAMSDSAGPQRIYCADGAALRDWARIPCFEDRDGDGALESRIFGLGESGNKADQLSILAKAQPIAAPVRYRPAVAGEVPEIAIAVTNCSRGHERPAFTMGPAPTAGRSEPDALALALGAPPAEGLTPEQLAQRRSEIDNLVYRTSGVCTESQRVREGEPLHPGAVAKGGAVARMHELVVSIGSKEEGAPVRLLGLRDPERLYRRSYGGFLPVSDGPTFKQKGLALEQKFDRPVLQTAGAAEVNEGRRAVGDTIMTVGFRHGYMGVLTQDTVIRTLFSKRSLPQGTVLYGVPMSYSTTLSYGGRPIKLPTIGVAAPDPEEVRLVWCVPVQDAEEWSATCLPHQGSADRYTLLKGQRPAFEVTGFSFAANQASNPGAVPVEMQEGDFGQPLSWRFRLKEIAADHILLTQETLFGDSLISSKDISIIRTAGADSGLSFSGGMIAFSDVEGAADAMNVKLERPLKIGSAPAVQSGIIRFKGPVPSPPLPPPQPSSPSN